jgi:hypothetical protein
MPNETSSFRDKENKFVFVGILILVIQYKFTLVLGKTPTCTLNCIKAATILKPFFNIFRLRVACFGQSCNSEKVTSITITFSRVLLEGPNFSPSLTPYLQGKACVRNIKISSPYTL